MKGVWTALITPFKADGGLDLKAFRKIIQDQKKAAVAGVIPCGTTGESPALSIDEKKSLIQATLEELKGSQTLVVAGTGSNNTAESVEFSRWASKAGAHGVLVVTPYYNKPSQAGMLAHFRAIADAIECEMMLYNVPGRTGVSLTPQTVAELASHPRITTIKEATGNPAFTSDIFDRLNPAGRRIDVLSGDDATYLPLLSVGASGIVSVASNLIPRSMVALQSAFDEGDCTKARAIHQKFYPIFRDLFVDSNPVPVKYAMARLGWCQNTLRAPLVALAKRDQEIVDASLAKCGLKEGTAA